ncbi:hypothetical protein PTKIN_Ptkin12aG0144100 [Pterospermum kingtungense]
MTSFQKVKTLNLQSTKRYKPLLEQSKSNQKRGKQLEQQKPKGLFDSQFVEFVMTEGQPQVKATLRLGSELYTVNAKQGGALSEQLSSMKEQSMSILKEFITKHNVPNDVPDELVEPSSGDEEDEEEDVSKKSNDKSKKPKIN